MLVHFPASLQSFELANELRREFAFQSSGGGGAAAAAATSGRDQLGAVFKMEIEGRRGKGQKHITRRLFTQQFGSVMIVGGRGRTDVNPVGCALLAAYKERERQH